MSKVATLFLDAGGVLVLPNWQRQHGAGRSGVQIAPEALAAEHNLWELVPDGVVPALERSGASRESSCL